jgi:hypothetical protein
MTMPSLDDPSNPKQILASSAPWLAAVLNVVPGLGAGYIYQRRWRAYWITAAVAGVWVGVGALPASSTMGALQGWHPLPGLLGLAALTAGEAFLAGRRARMN